MAHLRQFLDNENDCQEVLQETFIRVWLHRDQLQHIEFLSAYIKKIASRQCFTLLHNKAIRQKKETDAAIDDTGIDQTEEIISYKEAHKILQEAVSILPPKRRLIYEMSRSKGMNSREIADELGLSTSYVRNSLSASQETIRDHFKKAGKIILAALVFLASAKTS